MAARVKKFRALLILGLALALPGGARAQTATAPAKQAPPTAMASVDNPNKDKPLEITADQTLEWHRNELKYIARGNVVARQGTAVIQADTLTADYRQSKKSQNEIYRLTAVGHVVITSEKNTAAGDNAVYDVDTGIATLTGRNLTLTSPDQVVTARDKFTYEVPTGRLTAVGDAKAVRKTGKGTDIITADTLSAWFKQDSTGKRTLDKIAADDHVVITTPTDVLHGDHGEYIESTRIATLTGHVLIQRDKNVLEGDRAEIDLNTNVSRMISAPGTQGRVRGVFYPGSGGLAPNGLAPQPKTPTAPATAAAPAPAAIAPAAP